jgi:hypothetical protein
MDPRTAAHALTQIAALLDLRGENRFKSRAYQQAARRVLTLDTDDIGPLVRSGDLDGEPGFGPATLGVLASSSRTATARTSSSSARTPRGARRDARVPGSAPPRSTRSTRGSASSRCRRSRRPRATARSRRSALRREDGREGAAGDRLPAQHRRLVLYPHARAEAARCSPRCARTRRASAPRWPGRCGGGARSSRRGRGRRRAGRARAVAASFAHAPGVRDVSGAAAGRRCATSTARGSTCTACAPEQFAVALWRAPGARARRRDGARRARGSRCAATSCATRAGRRSGARRGRALRARRLAFVPPELREGAARWSGGAASAPGSWSGRHSRRAALPLRLLRRRGDDRRDGRRRARTRLALSGRHRPLAERVVRRAA